VTPEPGIYPDIPMTEYLAWRAASNSGLGRILRSPAHYRAYVETDQPDTPAFRMGRAVHMAVLQPDLFPQHFAQEPDTSEGEFATYANPRATKLYKELRAALEMTGKDILTMPEWWDVEGMTAAVLAHPRASKLIRNTGAAELSVVADDPATGVRVKTRLDWHTPSTAGGAIVDLKTTGNASPGEFERAIYRYGYHRQGALYLRAAREAGLPAAHFVIIAVEKEPPYGVILYRLTDEAIRLGEVQIDYSLALYKRCKETGEWPGYTTDVVDIGVPKWADAAVERDLEEVAI